jgi:hypothetical protein
MFFASREELGRSSLAERLPTICEWREMAVTGCLASYGVTLRELVAIQAALTDKMLRGVPPGEAPDPIRAGDQPESGPRDRRRDPACRPRPRRRDHRMIDRFRGYPCSVSSVADLLFILSNDTGAQRPDRR